MRKVSKRELNHQTAAVLESVTSNEPVVITERGQEKWLITRVTSPMSEATLPIIAKLATNREIIQTFQPIARTTPAKEVLDDLRDERL